MIIDQLIQAGTLGVTGDSVEADIVDILLIPEKENLQSLKIGDIEIDLAGVVLRKAPDASNDTMKWTVHAVSGKLDTPFLGIPFEKNKTSLKTMLKAAYVLYTYKPFQDLLLELGVEDLPERTKNAQGIQWKNKKAGIENEPNSAYKATNGLVLPCVGKTKQGYLILGIIKPTKNRLIDDKASIALTSRLLHPDANQAGGGKRKGGELLPINPALHMGDGLGRNSFGKKVDGKSDPSEFARIYGFDQPQNIDLLQDQWSNLFTCLTYRVSVNPVPDQSYLAFFCQDEETFETVKSTLKVFKIRPQKKEKTEDGIKLEKRKIPILPNLEQKNVSIALVCPEAGNKPKNVVTDFFPKIPLKYWAALETEFQLGHSALKLITFTKTVKNGSKNKATAAAYTLWTRAFTLLLNRQKIPTKMFWNLLGSYYKAWPTRNLLPPPKGKVPKGENSYEYNRGSHWLEICQIINRLNAIVDLETSQNLQKTPTTEVFNLLDMKENTVTEQQAADIAETRLGQVWDLLEYQDPTTKEKKPRAAKKKVIKALIAWENDWMDEGEKTLFTKGLLTGAILSSGETILKSAGRNFSAGQGRHLTDIRGEALSQNLLHMASLARNYNKGAKKNINPIPKGALPHLLSWEEDSKTTTFNNGLICGMDVFVEGEPATIEEEILNEENPTNQ